MRKCSVAAIFLYMAVGVVVWAAAFSAAYGWTAVNCAREVDGTGQAGLSAGLAAIGAVSMLALFGFLLLVRARRPRGPQGPVLFIESVAVTTAGIGAVAVLWNFLPVLIIPGCS